MNLNQVSILLVFITIMNLIIGCKKLTADNCDGAPIITEENLVNNLNTGEFCNELVAYTNYEYIVSFSSVTGNETPIVEWEIPEGAKIISQENNSAIIQIGENTGNICVTLSTECGTSDKVCREITKINKSNIYINAGEFPGGLGHSRITMTIDDIAYAGLGFSQENGESYHYNWYKFDDVSLSWIKLNDFPDKSVITVGKATTVGNNGYVYFDDGSFWKYDPKSDNWSKEINLESINKSANCLLGIGERIYNIMCQVNSNFLNEVWEYDLNSKVWKKKKNFPGEVVSNPSSFVLENRGIIKDGYTGGNCNSSTSFGKAQNYIYDPAIDLWLEYTNSPLTDPNFSLSFATRIRSYTGEYKSYYVNNGKVYIEGSNGFIENSKTGCGYRFLSNSCNTAYVRSKDKIISIDADDGFGNYSPSCEIFVVRF